MATAKQRKAQREAIKLASADDLRNFSPKPLPPKPATNPTNPKANDARSRRS
jgi:hypothetical protein